jgi:hypothetical protein
LQGNSNGAGDGGFFGLKRWDQEGVTRSRNRDGTKRRREAFAAVAKPERRPPMLLFAEPDPDVNFRLLI